MFGTVIVILKDTVVGRLHVDGLDIPENLEPGYVVVGDTSCLYQVTVALRSEDRVTVTVVL